MTTPTRLSLTSWALYDFANTIFSAVVLTAYFPLYLTELTGANWYLGAATTSAMILAGLAIPFFGALSDQTGKTKKYLLRSTLICIGFMALLSASRMPLILIMIFIVACFFYHASLVFYNSLLVVVAPPEKQGFASGLGTGLGYLGVVFALPIAHTVDQTFGRSQVFLGGALLFFIFSLPLFFWVPERPLSRPRVPERISWRGEWKKLTKTIYSLSERPRLLLFLGGNFFVVDALNSAIFWISVYAREVFHPGQNLLIGFLIALNAAAFLAGLLAGVITDRWGAIKTLTLSGFLLVLTLGSLSLVSSFAGFVAITLSAGAFAIAGIWTAGRKALVELVEPDRLGEYFGLYGLTTKVSVVGSLIFSVVADQAGFPTALRVLVFPAAAGSIVLLLSQKAPGAKAKGARHP